MLSVDSGALRTRHRTVWLPAFHVDLTLVTIGEYARYREATTGDAIIGPAEHEPMLGLRWQDAQGYARWAGKQIISYEQWERAIQSRCRPSRVLLGVVRQPGWARTARKSSRWSRGLPHGDALG